MSLEEEAVRAALLGMTNLPSGVEGPSLPTPQNLVDQGSLRAVTAGGVTGYEDPRSGIPTGGTYDADSPYGYTIADPVLRENAANAMGGLARAVAQQRYMDAYDRDRQKNTESILQSARGLDPDLQALIMQKLGLSVPGAGQPGAYGLNGADGIFGSKLRAALLPKILENQLNAPNKQMDQMFKMMQMQAMMQNAQTNEDYRRNLTDRGNLAQQVGLLAKIKELSTARQALMQPGPGRDLNKAAMLGQLIDLIGTNFLGAGGDQSGADSEGGGTNWWDQFMPSNASSTATNAITPPAGGRGAAMMRNPPTALRPKVTRIN